MGLKTLVRTGCAVLNVTIPDRAVRVLDGGYLRFIEAWGYGDAGEYINDPANPREQTHDYECGIIEAARQSTQGNFQGWEKDEKLLRSLYMSDPQHAGPFEFSGCTIEVQAPLIVFREWHRHRTQSYNEMSARYAPMPDNNYVPDWEVLKQRGEAAEKTRNRQEKGTHPWNEQTAKGWWNRLTEVYIYLEKVYNDALLSGVPKELARLVIPVGRYSRMRATANLRNWLAFMTLRFDPAAQWEIRAYATVLADILKEKFPKTWALYVEKKSPEHRIKKFTDEQLRDECIKRGIEIVRNFKEDVR